LKLKIKKPWSPERFSTALIFIIKRSAADKPPCEVPPPPVIKI
jgi:hypothetical protein